MMQSLKPNSSRSTRVVRFELSFPTMITIVLVIAGLWVMVRLMPVVLVLVAALFIVGTLSPAVSWLEAHRVRRGLSIGIVFTSLLVATLLIGALTVPEFLAQMMSLIDQEPALRARLVARLAGSHLTAPLAEALRTMKYDALMQSFGATAFTL
jgi:predicted PurR-regulated permease PerM